MTTVLIILTVVITPAVLFWSATTFAPTWADAWWVAAAVALHLAFLTWAISYCIRERTTWRSSLFVLAIPVTSTLFLPVAVYLNLIVGNGQQEDTYAPEMYVNEPWAATQLWTRWFWAEMTLYDPGEAGRISSAAYACDGVDGDEAMRAMIRGTEPWTMIVADDDMWVDEQYDPPTYEIHDDTATVHQPIMLKKAEGSTGGFGYGVGTYSITFTAAQRDDLWCVQSIEAVTRTG